MLSYVGRRAAFRLGHHSYVVLLAQTDFRNEEGHSYGLSLLLGFLFHRPQQLSPLLDSYAFAIFLLNHGLIVGQDWLSLGKLTTLELAKHASFVLNFVVN